MIRTLTFTVTEDEQGMSLLEWLRQKGCSRQVLAHLKNTKGLLRNGARPFAKEPVQAGDRIEIQLTEEAGSEGIVPVCLPFSVVYEDEDLLVIDKPAGLPVHPSINHYENTLANGVMWRCQQTGEPFPFRCINRLDAGTTGLLIIAKNMFSAAVLYSAMKKRKIKRTYLAVASGEIREPGTVDLPIGRVSDSVIERCIDQEHGERAVTHYEPVAVCKVPGNGSYTMLRLQLETGRTHQIRVHMKAIGHPLAGDYLYAPEDCSADRPLLHSRSLAFTHPVTQEPMKLTAELPEDMKNYAEWKRREEDEI